MAWTVLSDATLEVGKALRALTMRNLRDNITALANGDAGAPQIQTAAIAASAVTAAKIADYNVGNAKLAAPGAGDSYLLRSLLGSVAVSKTGNAYPAWDDPVGNEASFRAINYGSVRVRFEHYSGGTNTAYARIVVDGGVVAEWAGTGINTVHSRVADIGISPGQRIVVQVRSDVSSQLSHLRNCNVFSSVMAVGVI